MNCRLLALSEIIAPYRIPVFNELARQSGIDLHVVFLAENDPTLRQWTVRKDEIHFSYEVLPAWRRRIAGHNILLNRGVARSLEQRMTDHILVGGYNYLASWQALAWARRKQIPVLLWVESTGQDKRGHHRPVEFAKAAFMQRCDRFVVPGRSSLEYLMSYHLPRRAIFTAPNAVDIEFFARSASLVRRDAAARRRALQLPSRFFLFVGRLVREKGVFDLLEAYGRLDPGIREKVGLVFAGDGVSRPELIRRAASIAPGTIQFPGFLQRECLASYYALADAFVFPTRTDPWGLVVNEAMACGLPVISTRAAGCTADLVKERCNGRVVEAGEIRQLAGAMDELARDPIMRTAMGRQSTERIARYSPQLCAAGIAEAVFSCGGPRLG
jgi:glycosyltransferase involved in cell wall biosynthesis